MHAVVVALCAQLGRRTWQINKKHNGRDVSPKSTAPGKLGQATVMREVPCGFRPVTGRHNTAHKALREVHACSDTSG